MSMFTGFRILGSGMSAQRTRMNVTSSNLANANTTRTEDGGAYRRRDPVFKAIGLQDVNASEPISAAMRCASSRVGTPPSEPGTHGTPSFFIVSLAVILSPMTRMWSAVGPMKVSPWS